MRWVGLLFILSTITAATPLPEPDGCEYVGHTLIENGYAYPLYKCEHLRREL